MRKYYILDTNVLLHDPDSLLSFQDNHVIVPIYVIEEVDHFKRQQSELGHNARRVSRILDTLRRQGNLSEGVQTPAHGTLRVAIDPAVALDNVQAGSNVVDNALLSLASQFARSHPESRVVLVTKDTNLRIKADAIGIAAEDYETGRVDLSSLRAELPDLPMDRADLDRLAAGERVPLESGATRHPNEYVRLCDAAGGRRTVLGRVAADARSVQPLHPEIATLPGVRPRNMEQHFALDALLDDSIQLVTLAGRAGTGKTLLALAAGLQRACRESRYARLLVGRPLFPMGRDLGYLPGGVEAKLDPWMQPIYDNLELLYENEATPQRNPWQIVQGLLDNGRLAIQPLTFIRGRSIPHQYFIVDEAQNLTPLETKTIVTRAGEGTKIIFTGDPDQIDNPYIDPGSSGFNVLVERFQDDDLAAHVLLRKGERSPLAERGSQRL